MTEQRSTETVTIDSLGHRGDGIATGADGPLFVPFALPGERVEIERDGERGRIVEIVDRSSDRVLPICRHFGVCGGCAVQMMPLEATRRLKRDFVVTSLRQHGIGAEVSETIGVPVASRRRAALTALRQGNRVILGYHERLSHRLVDIAECPVLSPPLFGHLAGLRPLVSPLISERRPVRMTALLTRTGIDIALEGARLPASGIPVPIAEAAAHAGLSRLSVDGEPILTLAEPVVNISGIPLSPPPGAFLQASAEAEATMTDLVVGHLSDGKRVADLFSGIGTFALALARNVSVHAVEANQPALDALAEAVRNAKRLKPIGRATRDLFRDPLSPGELKGFDGVVFDPPRAGAKEQAAALAGSRVARVVAVSCNPGTFARDARILIDGGYVLKRAVPIDQFVYSAATEVVGLFVRS